MILGHHRRDSRPRVRARREVGESLIEVLITVFLMGIVVIAILTALLVLVQTAALNKEKTRAAVTLQMATEKTKSAVGDLEYVPCGTAATYDAKLQNVLGLSTDADAGVHTYSVHIIDVAYRSGDWKTKANNGQEPFLPFVSSCPGTTTVSGTQRDGGIQRVTLEVRSGTANSYQVEEQMIIVKRDARCPVSSGGYQNPDAGPC